MSIFTDNVALIKKVCNLSSGRIAKLAGVPTSTVTRILSDEHKPRAATVSALARAFHIADHDLLFKKLTEDDILFVNGDSVEGYEGPVAVPAAGDIVISPEDLNNHAKLLKLAEEADKLTPTETRVVGSVLLNMPTDELAPTIPRQSRNVISRVFLKIEKDQFNPNKNDGSDAVGIIDSRTDGEGSFVFGKLSFSQGKMFIKPVNPNLPQESVEVCRVTARVCGWVVIPLAEQP